MVENSGKSANICISMFVNVQLIVSRECIMQDASETFNGSDTSFLLSLNVVKMDQRQLGSILWPVECSKMSCM